MTSDPQAAATKADVQMIMDELGKLYDANERWKDALHGKMDRWKEEIKGHFDFSVETIRHDLVGANNDRLVNHENRLTRIEQHVGLAS